MTGLEIYQAISFGIENVVKRIHISAFNPDGVMNMVSNRTARIAHKGNHFSSFHFLSFTDIVSW